MWKKRAMWVTVVTCWMATTALCFPAQSGWGSPSCAEEMAHCEAPNPLAEAEEGPALSRTPRCGPNAPRSVMQRSMHSEYARRADAVEYPRRTAAERVVIDNGRDEVVREDNRINGFDSKQFLDNPVIS